MIILVNPPTLWEIRDLGMLGRTSCFELQATHVEPDALKSFPGEHLGLLSLTAACRARGMPASVVNGQILLHRSVDQTWEEIVSRAGEPGPDVLGFSGPCQVFEENAELAARAKDRWPQTVTTLGSDFATLNAERILRDYDAFDVVVAGEAERAFPDLCERVLGGRGYDDVPRVISRSNVVGPRVAAPLLDLDDLEWIARDDLPAVLGIGLSAGVFTTRGCPYRCTFCTTGQLTALNGRAGYREKSIENVVDEIAYLVRDFSIDYVTITDDLFVTKSPASQERARRFAEAYRARGLASIPFMIDCRVDSMDPDTLRALRAAGLHRIFVGVESATAQTLAAYDKTYGSHALPEYVVGRLSAAESLGIDLVPGIITYHPSATIDELRQTLQTVDSIGYRGSFQFLNKVFAHPGTPLWRDYLLRGVLDPEWPVPAWDFEDPAARDVAERTIAAAGEGADFDGIRAAFAHALEDHAASGVG